MRETEVMPAVRIPKRLWLRLRSVMAEKMLMSKAELIREALREHAAKHRESVPDFHLVEAVTILEEGRAEDSRKPFCDEALIGAWVGSSEPLQCQDRVSCYETSRRL